MIKIPLFHTSYALHLMLCILLVSSHTYAFAIDSAEQEIEEVQEQAPVEVANLEQEQGMPQ
jgi:hypothetical protein